MSEGVRYEGWLGWVPLPMIGMRVEVVVQGRVTSGAMLAQAAHNAG